MSEYQDLPLSGIDSSWDKVVVTHTQLAAASTTNTVVVGSLPAKTVVHKVIVKHSEQFSGGSISGYLIDVGVTGTGNKFIDDFDVDTAPSDSNSATQDQVDNGPENFSSPTDLTITAVATGDNLDQATQGELEVWLLVSKLP